jgi:hypothetical protein
MIYNLIFLFPTFSILGRIDKKNTAQQKPVGRLYSCLLCAGLPELCLPEFAHCWRGALTTKLRLAG